MELYEPPAKGQLLMDLARGKGLVRRHIQECTNCDLRCGMDQLGKTPVAFSAPSGPQLPIQMVIGEGPGQDEARKGEPFIGRSGKLLRAMFGQVHLRSDLTLFANAVNCWPTTDTNGTKTRAPNEQELRACRNNLLTQILLNPSEYILLVGGTALKTVRTDLKVSNVHGRMFVWHLEFPDGKGGMIKGSWWVMSIVHPAAILRSQDTVAKMLREQTVRELERWKDVVTGEVEPEFDYTCVACGGVVDELDPDGVGYCNKHWAKYGGEWKKSREFWKVKKPSGQGSLI